MSNPVQDASHWPDCELSSTLCDSLVPVGVGMGGPANEQQDVPIYRGVSFCDAVRRAGEGEALRVLPGSIEVCGWAPVVLGLKASEDRFEEGLAPRLNFPVSGLLLARLNRFPGEPDAVILRAGPDVLRAMGQRMGPEGLWDGHQGRLDRSAHLYLFEGQGTSRRGILGGVNRLLATLARSGRWQAFTQHLFRSRLVTAGFETLISRSLADMSVCRNSTAIPLISGQANISFFCTGGITWGGNRPEHLTSGWPWHLYQRAVEEGR